MPAINLFTPDWYERSIGRLKEFKPLKEDDIILLFDIDGTLYWEYQPSSIDVEQSVKAFSETEAEHRFPAGVPNGWYIQQRNNLINYVSALTGLNKTGAKELAAKCFAKYNQTLRGLIADAIIEDTFEARERYWHAMQYGSGSDGSSEFTKFQAWVQPDEDLIKWIRNLPSNYRKIAFTNAYEAVGLERLEAIGLNYDDFDVVLGAEFTAEHPKPKPEAFLKTLEHLGVKISSEQVTSTIPTTSTSPLTETNADCICKGDLIDAIRATSDSFSHPVVLFEDNFKNIKTANALGIGTVRIRNPLRIDSYRHQIPTNDLPMNTEDCVADVVVNTLSHLNVSLSE